MSAERNAPASKGPETAVPEESAEAELFAASAAENALTAGDGKSLSEEATDLSALAAALEPEDDSSNTAVISKTDNRGTEEAQPERQLTKEEMVEEALSCPCIAAMRDGPCGDSFLSAYRCFLESETEPKGMDCMEQFTGMQSCMAEHPEAYNLDDDDDDPFAAAENGKGSVETKAGDGNKDVSAPVERPPDPDPEPVSASQA